MTHITQITLASAAVSAALLLSACNYKETMVSSESASPDSTTVLIKQSLPTEDDWVYETESAQSIGATAGDAQAPVSIRLQERLGTDASKLTRALVVQPAWETATQPSTDNTEQYAALANNNTVLTASEPVSTFSIDVDTGAYSNVRRFLQAGHLPPSDAVRIEELLNYFSYNYPSSASVEQPFSVVTELGPTPWNDNTQLLHVGLQGYMPDNLDDLSANLVFLIDVSGSMDQPNKLGLLKSSISLLSHELDASDTVSIVVYAGASGTVLEPTAGDQHSSIDRALSRLRAGGSTNGAAGIELAYELAAEHFVEEGINRVILATDGDFNVGLSDTEALKKLIKQKRNSGIALTTLGFGTGNYNDHLMEQLADTGNGSYAYIDTLGEARKVLVDELTATLVTIAKDVKIQVEFNPAVVSEYRLIGYTNRHLNNEDFNNDKVDAGDIGAGHTVTALYEIALQGSGGERHTPRRYGAHSSTVDNDFKSDNKTDEIAELRLRYKLPETSKSRLITQIIRKEQQKDTIALTTDNFRFSAGVAAFGQLLRDNERLENFDYGQTRALAKTATGADTFGYRSEFIRLLDLANSIDRLERASNEHRSIDEG